MGNKIVKSLNLKVELKSVEKQIHEWFLKAKTHLKIIPSDLSGRVKLLSVIRKELYEELNQLQHVAAIIKMADSLQIEYPNINNWSWHPRQTSHPDDADLTGYIDKVVFLNAEISTSLEPIGTIDKHMKLTLLSLNKKKGLRFYFVLTENMFNRAVKKRRTNNLEIEIRKLI